MARFEHLPIYIKAEKLLTEVMGLSMSMKGKSTYTIGGNLRDATTKFAVQIARVNSMRDMKEREKAMTEMMNLLNEIYILLKVANKLNLFKNSKQHDSFLEDVTDLERQLERWKKSGQSPKNGGF